MKDIIFPEKKDSDDSLWDVNDSSVDSVYACTTTKVNTNLISTTNSQAHQKKCVDKSQEILLDNDNLNFIQEIAPETIPKEPKTTQNPHLLKENSKIFIVVSKSRKSESDNIRKKIKVKFHQYLFTKTRELLKKSKKKPRRFPQKFITSCSRKKNKEIFNLKYKELIQKSFGKDESYVEPNRKIVKFVEKNKAEHKELYELLNTTYKDLFQQYLDSPEFDALKGELSGKDGKNYADMFEKISKEYIKYYYSDNNSIK